MAATPVGMGDPVDLYCGNTPTDAYYGLQTDPGTPSLGLFSPNAAERAVARETFGAPEDEGLQAHLAELRAREAEALKENLDVSMGPTLKLVFFSLVLFIYTYTLSSPFANGILRPPSTTMPGMIRLWLKL